MKLIKRICRDHHAGIEGLPLQLMIMVVIAGVGTAVILGWMSNLNPPNSIGGVYSNPSEIVLIDADNDGLYQKSGISLTITVVDKDGNGIEGASVVLEGASIGTKDGRNPHSTTDAAGKAVFSGLTASQYGNSIGFVTVSVAKSGYGNGASLTIPVISE